MAYELGLDLARQHGARGVYVMDRLELLTVVLWTHGSAGHQHMEDISNPLPRRYSLMFISAVLICTELSHKAKLW